MAVGAMSAVLTLQLVRPLSPPRLSLVRPASSTVAGVAPVLPWPASGEAALSVPSAGLLISSGSQTPVPIASLTKMMTAYLVLEDHPLTPSASGPNIVMTAADAEDAAEDEANNDTVIPVTAGQSFTERQLLNGLLVHSANDFADALAQWDAGSTAAFVEKMNSAAQRLGMSDTHYVDPSGIDPSDRSTADDQLRLAQQAMTVPTFAAVVAQPSVTFPGVGQLSNYVPAVGTDGVVGVKSGFTQEAMGCVVLAADRQVGGRQVMVLAAVTGQQGIDPIGSADSSALALIAAATGGLKMATLVSAGSHEATVSASWTGRRVPAVTASAVTALVWPGWRWSFALAPRAPRGAVRSRETVAILTVRHGSKSFSVPVRTTGALPSASMRWRLLHH